MSIACSGVILAGGESKRLGGNNKAFLRIGGRRILSRLMEIYSRIFDQTVLVTNDSGPMHLAAAIGHGLTEQSVRVRYFATTALVQQLQLARKQLRLEDALHKLDRYAALILDDFGYVKKTEQETQVLFELIAHRYETGSLIVTSNQPFAEWDRIFPDQMMTVAAVDRLVHHATIIEVSSDSYRRKEALGQVTGEATTTTTLAATTTTPSPGARSGDVCLEPAPSG